MKKCIIIGAGKYGQVYAEYLKTTYKIVAFYDDNPDLQGKKINDIPVKDTIAEAFDIAPTVSVFIPIGDNILREKLIGQFRELGFNLPSFIHPTASLHSSVSLGETVYILPSCNVMPFSSIEDGGMLSVGVNISHHTKIGKGCFFSQGVNIGASITIEDYSYVGMGATIMTGVEIVGKNSLVGAGSVVIRNVNPNTVVAGVPAKYLRDKDILM